MIERRIRAAAEGDFVIAVYNPVSKRRTEQLPAMKAVLLEHRPPNTPVILARNLGRPGETITVTTLAALDAADVDMLTLVMIGSSRDPRGSARRRRHLGLHTPRLRREASGRESPMTVHFIGAGPGAPDLITIRGRDLIARCPVCLYAGSLRAARSRRLCA